MTVVYYKIRKETAVQDLNAIGWKSPKISNDEVVKKFFHENCGTKMLIVSIINGDPGPFFYPTDIRYSEALEPPLPTELGEIR